MRTQERRLRGNSQAGDLDAVGRDKCPIYGMESFEPQSLKEVLDEGQIVQDIEVAMATHT